ncbi:hypothetical protein EDD86DRAFT_189203 [Gorgonomyces haynaldii]|nr:hypothetical protein EDD86DRAFT_189203 [Gorgonomyces haynaldii]
MFYCPHCGNVLLLQEPEKLKCQSCIFEYRIERALRRKVLFENKQVDDVLGGEEQWDNVDQTDATCPKCENSRAYYLQIQTRSADEPMTTFYKCTKCRWDWKE